MKSGPEAPLESHLTNVLMLVSYPGANRYTASETAFELPRLSSLMNPSPAASNPSQREAEPMIPQGKGSRVWVEESAALFRSCETGSPALTERNPMLVTGPCLRTRAGCRKPATPLPDA